MATGNATVSATYGPGRVATTQLITNIQAFFVNINKSHDATLSFDLETEGIQTVIWATGFGRNYAWLKVPVLDAAGEIVHEGGVTPSRV